MPGHFILPIESFFSFCSPDYFFATGVSLSATSFPEDIAAKHFSCPSPLFFYSRTFVTFFAFHFPIAELSFYLLIPVNPPCLFLSSIEPSTLIKLSSLSGVCFTLNLFALIWHTPFTTSFFFTFFLPHDPQRPFSLLLL